MPTITLTDPVAGTVAASGLVATNNANLRTLLNSGLDYVNFKGNPQLVSGEVPVWNGTQWDRSTVTKIGATSLGTGTPDSTKFLRGDGAWIASAGYLTAPVKVNTLIDIVSSVTETDILNYSIPGNTLGANGVVRVGIPGDLLNNSGSTDTLVFKIYWGGTLIYHTSNSFGTFGSRLPFNLDFKLWNRNATNSQWLIGRFSIDPQIAVTPTVGVGNAFSLGTTNFWGGDFSVASDPAKDTTSAQTLRVSMQHSVNNASTSLRAYESLIEFI